MSDDSKPKTATGAIIQIMEDSRRSQMYKSYEKAWNDALMYGTGFLVVNAYGEIHYMTSEEAFDATMFIMEAKTET